MKLRQLWKLLSGVALLVSGLLVGASAPAAASTGGCAGDVVVALDVKVIVRSGFETYDFTLSEPLAAGVWSVQTSSSDSYEGRSDVVQTNEEWLLDIDGVTVGPTSDLADGVDAANAIDDLGTFVSREGVTQFTVRHAPASTPGPNSVRADCVGFTLVESPGDGLTAAAHVACADGTIEVRLGNTGALPSNFAVTIGDEATAGTLGAGTETVVGADIVAARTSVTVVGEAGTALAESLDTSCETVAVVTTTTTPKPVTTAAPSPPSSPPPPPPPSPLPPPPSQQPTRRSAAPAAISAAAVVDCAADEVLVLLGNEGDLGATVDLALPLSEVLSGIAVAGGTITTGTLAIGDLDDGIAEVRISDSGTGETYARVEVGLDCHDPPRPTAATVLDCVDEVVIIHLGNNGGDQAQLTVLHERVEVVAEIELAVGDVEEVTIPLGGADSVPVRVVDADGNDVVRVEVENVCPDPDLPGDDQTDLTEEGDVEDGSGGRSVARIDCASIDVVSGDQRGGDVGSGEASSADVFDVAVEIDGTVLIDGTASGRARIPVVPGVPTRIIVSESGSDTPAEIVTPLAQECAEVGVIVEPDCTLSSAEVSVQRDGIGRERFVVLLDGALAGVLAIDGTGTGTVPVALGDGPAELSVSRSMSAAPIVVGTLSCERDDGVAGSLAASLVVIAVIASAAAVVPWPSKLRFL
jgi:hypothetical protein